MCTAAVAAAHIAVVLVAAAHIAVVLVAAEERTVVAPAGVAVGHTVVAPVRAVAERTVLVQEQAPLAVQVLFHNRDRTSLRLQAVCRSFYKN